MLPLTGFQEQANPALTIWKFSEAPMTLSRRDFLKLAGKPAVVSTGLLAGCAATSTSTRTGPSAIEIHHHYFPPELIAEVKQHGKSIVFEDLAPTFIPKNTNWFLMPPLVESAQKTLC